MSLRRDWVVVRCDAHDSTIRATREEIKYPLESHADYKTSVSVHSAVLMNNALNEVYSGACKGTSSALKEELENFKLKETKRW